MRTRCGAKHPQRLVLPQLGRSLLEKESGAGLLEKPVSKFVHDCQLVGHNAFRLRVCRTICTLLSKWGVAVCVNL